MDLGAWVQEVTLGVVVVVVVVVGLDIGRDLRCERNCVDVRYFEVVVRDVVGLGHVVVVAAAVVVVDILVFV